MLLPLGSDYIIYRQPVEVTLVITTGLRLHHLPSTSRGDSCYYHWTQTTSSTVNQQRCLVLLPLGSDYTIYRQPVGGLLLLLLGSDYIIYRQPVGVTLVITTGLRLHHLPSTSRGDSCYYHWAQTALSTVDQ